MSRFHALAAPAAACPEALRPGDPAFFVDEGRRVRVRVRSHRSDALGQPTRLVEFVDEAAACYDVLEKLLEPCADGWGAPAAPDPLRSPKVRGLPAAAEPHEPPPPAAATVLSRYDRRAAEPPPPALLEAAELSRSQRLRLREAERLAAQPRSAGQARRLLLDLQAEAGAAEDAASLACRKAEVVALEAARGGTVEVGPRGRMRVLSRSGLQLAFERGNLDGTRVRGEILYELGVRYAAAFRLEEGLRTPDRTHSGGGGGFHSHGPQVKVIEAREALRTMRAGFSRRQREVLDRVCGLDLTVRAAAETLKAGFPSTAKALREGLVLAGENKGWF
jgi:hypothetical protein